MAKKKPRKKTAKPAAEAAQPASLVPKVGPVKYVGQVRQEGRKVVWPTQRETVVTTILVLIMTLFMGAFFFVTDTIISTIVQFVIGLGS